MFFGVKFTKAFDQVHHPLLIHKLKSLGVAGPVANWIQNWLSGRSQKVVVQGCMSDKVSVTSGTVQGSVLGPLLFLMYVDDFGNGTQSFNNKYADDTKFQNDVHSAVSAVVFQSDLNLLHQWCDLWKLNIHPEKSKVMHFGRSNPINTYFWGLNKLTSSNQLSDLGILIDIDLSFDKHVSEVVRKATMISILISRTISSRSPEVYLKLFISLVRPILEYAIEVWWPFLHKHIIAVERVQRRFTKRIIGLQNLSYGERLRTLNISSLWWRFRRGALITTFKILKTNFGGPSLRNNFNLSRNITTRGHKWKLERSHLKHVKTQNFFFNRIIPIWNDLPSEIVEVETVNNFKNKFDELSESYDELKFHYFE